MAKYYIDEKGKLTIIPSERKKTVFQKGAYSDGYQTGDFLKTVGSTVADVGVNIGKGVFRLAEGLVDLGAYGVAEVADILGADNAANAIKKEAQADSTNLLFGGVDKALNKNSALGYYGDAVAEGVGQVAGILLTGGVAGAAGVTGSAASALTTGVLGASAMGSGIGEAYNSGATDGQAFAYGVMNAGVEVISERIFAGLGKAVNLGKAFSSADDVVASKLGGAVRRATEKAFKSPAVAKAIGNVTEYAVKSGAEGVEEVVAGLGNAVAKKLTYESDEDLKKLVKDENLLEQFIVGSIVSGIAQGGDVITSIKQGKDFVSGYTDTEQKVVDKAIENRLAEKKKANGKVTAKDKSNIADSVKRDLERGYFTIDEINEALGGDSYKAYKSYADSQKRKETAISAKIEALEKKINTADGETDVSAIREELATARAKLDNLKKTDKTAELKAKLDADVIKLASGSKLDESYREITRKGENFSADLTKYTAKEQAIVQKAIDSGVLNNTNRTHDFVDFVARVSASKGIDFDFADNAKIKESGFAVDGAVVNGYVNENGITLNAESVKSLDSVVGHEITHVLQGTKLYDSLKSTITEYAKSKGIYDGRLKAIQTLYEGKNADIEAELTADLVGDLIFTDEAFINRLTSNRTLFDKIFGEIKYLARIATAGSREARQLEKAKVLFEKAYDREISVIDGVRYSVSNWSEQKNKTQSEITANYQKTVDNILSGNHNDNSSVIMGYTPLIYRELGMPSLPFVIGVGHIYSIAKTKTEAIQEHKYNKNNNYHGLGEQTAKKLYEAIQKPIMIISSKDVKRNAKPLRSTHSIVSIVDVGTSEKHLLLPIEITATRTVNGNNMDVNVLSSAYERDITNLIKEAVALENVGDVGFYYIKKGDTTIVDSGVQFPVHLNNKMSSNGIIRNFSEKVNMNLLNVTQSLQFKRWFGDWQNKPQKASKVVDEDGTPIVMYHGTNSDSFTIFDSTKSDKKVKLNALGDGYYFTKSKERASRYGKNIMETYLDIKTPYKVYPRDGGVKAQIEEDFGISAGSIHRNDIQKILESKGYDGILLYYSKYHDSDWETAVVFKPTQIKSATDNIGTYDKNNPDINYSLSPLNTTPEGKYTGESIAYRPKATESVTVDKKTDTISVKNSELDMDEVAKILDESTIPTEAKRSLLTFIEENLLDKGMVFEHLSDKTGNRELEAKWQAIRNSERKAQEFINRGADGMKSLNTIRKEVEATGKVQEFADYMYHALNVDRMTLSERYGTENKPVFGEDVDADTSRYLVEQYEAQNPEFKQFAQEVYDYMNHLRSLMVDEGIITQETADLWAEKYPHYVPIHRADKNGNAVTVPLDTNRTGVNAPIKKATGGNQDINPLFVTMAERTSQTFKAIAKNSFGVELRNTLGENGIQTASQDADLESITENIADSGKLLKPAENGNAPTFTVFVNGERVTFAINEDMYNALKPMSEKYAQLEATWLAKGVSYVNNVFRNLVTSWNPLFGARNFIKDVQDVLLNSQHAGKTYKNIPSAFAQSFTHKGHYYDEYIANGGGNQSYFDNKKKTFEEDKTGIAKAIDRMSWLNDAIEMTPRLAEYIASREAGRSIEVSMLDAARVTTNFQAGADLTKFLNRNGATFLNASVQGMVQNIRNVKNAHKKGIKGYAILLGKFAFASIPVMVLNHFVWGDDEEYEELSDYIKDNYYIIGKINGTFIRIPKGRTLSVIQNAVEQVAKTATGNAEIDVDRFADLVLNNLAPNNPISDNLIAPIIQTTNNKAWHGGDIVPTRLQDEPAAEQYDETTDAFSKWLGEQINVSPYKINYLIDQYSGVIGDIGLPFMTPQAESGAETVVGKAIAPLIDSFTADAVFDNKHSGEFYDTKEELTSKANSINATDKDILKRKFIDSVSTDLSELYRQKREIENSNLSDSEKYKRVKEIQRQINSISEETLSEKDNVEIFGSYAEVSDRQYYLNKDNEWTKITDKQKEKQDKVTEKLGISPSEYWENKDMYDDAYDTPEKYAVSKAFDFDYTTYKDYLKGINKIEGVKDKNGNTINGSTKKNVIAHIESLPLSRMEKAILFKYTYPKDATYNKEIIQHLRERTDIPYADRVAILEGLGFKVKDGKVKW